MLGSSKSATAAGEARQAVVPGGAGGRKDSRESRDESGGSGKKEKKKEESKKEKKEMEKREKELERQKKEIEKEKRELEKREKELEKKNKKKKKDADKEHIKKSSSSSSPAPSPSSATSSSSSSSASSSSSSSSTSSPSSGGLLAVPYVQSERRRSGSWIRPRSLKFKKASGVSKGKGDSVELSGGGSSAELDAGYPPSPSSSGPLSPTATPSPASPSRGARGPPSHGQDYEGRAASVVQEAAVRRSGGMVTMAAEGGDGGARASMADGSLLETLKRLKSNDRDLTEFKTPPTIMQELQASTLELIKIISDCLVFNTHLKKLDLSGCEMKEVEVKLLAEALRVNSTLEYLNITWCNLGDAGSAALAAGLGMNEGLKVVDMRHNRITAKGLHAIASFLRTNITLLELLLSKSEQLLIAGDDLIFDDSDNSSLVDQEHRDKHKIEEILLSNKTLSKCFSGESKKVDLSGRGMEKVPSLFLVIPTIVSLDLSHNRLKYLPRGIKQLTRLEFLNLSHNQLQELPLELGTLHTLKHLDVQHNNLTEVPLTLNLLDNLEVLDISHNNISFLPVSLGTLPSLKELHAHSNPLPYPKKVVLSSAGTGVLSYLREKNSGSALCHRIKLMCVGQANVGKTSLVEKLLSKSVTKPTESESGSARAAGRNAHPDDQDLGTSGTSMGAEVNNKAVSAVKRTDSERNRRWSYSEVEHGKLALISSGGASGGDEWDGNDKSSSPASKARRRPGKRLDVATDGIRIRDWTAKSISRKDSSAKEKADKKDSNSSKLEGSKENIITFSSWDFAGQEIYYYTHLFFLSRRGIYLLIFNLLKPEEEASRIEYWLQSIHTRARGAPVILVGTHLDAKKCTKKYLDHLYANLLQKFSGQFKNIRFFFALSCATGKGVEDLRKKLIEVAQSMIEKEGLIPQSYLTLEEKIRAIAMLEPQPVVSWEMFERLALSSGVTQPVLPKAAKYLHQLGSLVHFNERESGLDDLVILDSQWLTNVFSDVITLKHNFVKSGVLQRKDLPQIWKAPAYPETVHDSLVALLEQFEVAYALPPTDANPQGAILVPCLLPDARPADLHNPDLWPKEESDLVQLFRFYSFDFMPFGFFNRFMVRLLRSGWTLIRCWKNGMFFAKGDDKLLLELDMEVAFRLKLCMRGTTPSRQMLVLTAMIDTLIADWLRVDVKVTIPCTHCINENAQPFLFTQTQLEQAVAKGKTVVNCRGVDVVGIFALAPDLVMLDLNRIIVKQEDMRIIDQLALNNRTKIFKAQLGDETVVVKQFREESLSASSLSATAVSNEFRAQVWEIGGLEHPNIVPLRGMCEDPFSLVMEHIEGPSLETFLADPTSHRLVPLDWKFRIKIAADIARAMMFLHNLTPRVINGRLTSSNVLLAMENVSQESVVVAKIADFGLFWAPIYVENREDAPYWLAPEVLSKQKHTAQSDVYSYGTLLYELVTGDTLFASQIPESGWSGVEKRIIAGDRPEVPTDCYVEYKDLMADCWNADPALRPSFELILKRISRIAIKYNLPLPGPSGKIALPSYSVRKFSVAYENEEEDTRRNKSRRRKGSSPPMPLEETDTEPEVEEQAAETLAPTAATSAATSNVAPASTPAPAEAPKEENSIKKRLQNTLATLQRELESDEQELITSSGAMSPPPSSPSSVTGAAVPRLPSSGTVATKQQAEGSTPPPLRRREATPTVAAGSRQVSTLTLRSSGSGSMKAQVEQDDKGSFNSALQRQADRMREQVESLQSQLKEAKKAQSKAERSLAFQILENDRQHTQMERLKRKVEALKSENDKLVKEARQSGTPGTAPRMMKTVRTGQASKQSSPAPLRDGERDLTTVAVSASAASTSGSIAPREDDTPALASSMSEDYNKKRQLTAISTSTRAQRGLFTPYASPEVPEEEVDVREIQERLRRRSLSKRILDRLAYWENMQQRQVVPATPSSLGSKSSGLTSRASTTHARPITRSPKLGEREPHRRASAPVVDDSSSESDSSASSSSSDSGALLPQNTQPKVAVADRAGSPPRSTSSDDTGCNAPKASGDLGVSAADAAVARSRLASHAGRYQKRERAKAVRGYSASDMAAILGAAPAAAQAFPVAIVAAGRAPSLDSSDASDGPDSDADAAASPAPTVIAAQSSPAVAAGPPPWWSGIFVRGGLVGKSSRKRAAAAGGHSKAERSSGGVGAGSSGAEAGAKEKIQIHGFRERDQENLYTQAHDGAVHGKQGLGRASAPKKVAGAHWCGTKTRLGSDSEGEGGQGSGSGSEASSGNITRDSNEEVGLSDDEVGVTVVTSKQQQAAVAGQQHQQQQLAAQSQQQLAAQNQQQQSPDQGNKAAGGSGQQTVSTGEKRKQKKAARGQQGQEAPPLHCQQQQQEGKQQPHVVSAAEEHPQSTSAVKQKRKKTAHLAEAVGSAGSTRGDAQPDSVAAKGRKKKKKEKHADYTVATLADAQPEVATQETKEDHGKDAGGTRAARQAGDQLKPGKVAWARLARHALAEAPDRCMKARKLLRKIMEGQAAAVASGQLDIARVAEPQQLQTMLVKLSKYADLRVEGKRVTLVPA